MATTPQILAVGNLLFFIIDNNGDNKVYTPKYMKVSLLGTAYPTDIYTLPEIKANYPGVVTSKLIVNNQ